MFSSRPWHFLMLRSGLREAEIRVWQKQTPLPLIWAASLCLQWHRWSAHAGSLWGWKTPLSQRRAAWSRQHGHAHTCTPCMCPCSHPCMHAHPRAHTLPSAACYIAPPSWGTHLLHTGYRASCWPVSWVFPSILVLLRDSSETSE